MYTSKKTKQISKYSHIDGHSDFYFYSLEDMRICFLAVHHSNVCKLNMNIWSAAGQLSLAYPLETASLALSKGNINLALTVTLIN